MREVSNNPPSPWRATCLPNMAALRTGGRSYVYLGNSCEWHSMNWKHHIFDTPGYPPTRGNRVLLWLMTIPGYSPGAGAIVKGASLFLNDYDVPAVRDVSHTVAPPDRWIHSYSERVTGTPYEPGSGARCEVPAPPVSDSRRPDLWLRLPG